METSTLQTIAQPSNPHHGLASLPPEILAHIRICLKDLDEPYHIELHRFDFAPNTSFPLVCRRFRNLEMSIPSLWTLLTDSMTADRINLHVARSGALGLKVRLFIYGETGCICEKWKLLAQCSHRWSILAVRTYEQNHNCFSTLRGLLLPSLWSLNLFGIDEDVIPILSTWTIPSVRALNSFKMSALLALPLTQSLTTLRLNHGHAAFDVDGLLDFLGSTRASQLTALQLSFYRLNVQRGLPFRYKALTLPMLQDLSLWCLVNIQVPEQAVVQLMRHIALPSIQFVTLVLSKDIVINDTFINWLRSLKNPSLRTVTVRVHGDSDGSSKGGIVDTFQGGGDGVFQVESSIDAFGTLEVNIDFT